MGFSWGPFFKGSSRCCASSAKSLEHLSSSLVFLLLPDNDSQLPAPSTSTPWGRDKAPALLSAAIHSLQKHHAGHFLILNIFDEPQPSHQPCTVQFPSPTGPLDPSLHPPRMVVVAKVCQAASEWIRADPENVVVVRSSMNLVALFDCCLRLYLGLLDQDDVANVSGFAAARAKDYGTRYGLAPTLPSTQRRFVGEFEAMVKRNSRDPLGISKMPAGRHEPLEFVRLCAVQCAVVSSPTRHPVEFSVDDERTSVRVLQRVKLTGPPHVLNCRVFFMITQGSTAVYSGLASVGGIQPWPQFMTSKRFGSLNLPLYGDYTFKLYHFPMTVGAGVHLASFSFHTATFATACTSSHSYVVCRDDIFAGSQHGTSLPVNFTVDLRIQPYDPDAHLSPSATPTTTTNTTSTPLSPAVLATKSSQQQQQRIGISSSSSDSSLESDIPLSANLIFDTDDVGARVVASDSQIAAREKQLKERRQMKILREQGLQNGPRSSGRRTLHMSSATPSSNFHMSHSTPSTKLTTRDGRGAVTAAATPSAATSVLSQEGLVAAAPSTVAAAPVNPSTVATAVAARVPADTAATDLALVHRVDEHGVVPLALASHHLAGEESEDRRFARELQRQFDQEYLEELSRQPRDQESIEKEIMSLQNRLNHLQQCHARIPGATSTRMMSPYTTPMPATQTFHISGPNSPTPANRPRASSSSTSTPTTTSSPTQAALSGPIYQHLRHNTASTTPAIPPSRSFGASVHSRRPAPHKLKPAILSLLPSLVYSSSSSASLNMSDCQICQDPYLEGDSYRFLPCMHPFHLECIDQWLLVKETCPICVASVTEMLKTNGQLSTSQSGSSAAPIPIPTTTTTTSTSALAISPVEDDCLETLL